MKTRGKITDQTPPLSKHPVMGSYISKVEAERIVKCSKCKFKHPKGERVVEVDIIGEWMFFLCPNCHAESYNNCP